MATLGHYGLVRELGEGGMATVYEAVDHRIGRTVALKVLTLPFYLSQGQRETMIARLMREARAAGRLSHPSIVTIYEVDQQDGHHYIAMEHLPGCSLRQRLEKGALSGLEAAAILRQVAAALDHAHVEGVLHRDIKPSNVMLLPDGRVKLADFGVARRSDDARLTQTGVPVGSPAYMAPEAVRGEPATAASDRWSLGVLLYEMLAGRPPFVGEGIPFVLHQVAYHPAPPVPGAPGRIQKVLDRALEKSPDRRYPSAQALADAFEAAVTGTASVRRPVSSGVALVKRAGGGCNPKPDSEAVPVARGQGGASVLRALPTARLRRWNWIRPLVALAAAAPLLAVLFVGYTVRPHSRSAAPSTGSRSVGAPAPEGPRVGTSVPPQATVQVQEVTARKEAPSKVKASRPATRSRPTPPSRTRVSSQPAARTAPSRRAAPPQARRARVSRSAGRTVTVRTKQKPRIRRPQPASSRVARFSGSVAALDARGYRLLRQGRAAAAEPLLREAVRRNPNYAYSQYNLGWSLLAQGKAREALGPLRRTAAQQPNRWEPQQRLGQAYERLGHREAARAAYARARALRRSPRRRANVPRRPSTPQPSAQAPLRNGNVVVVYQRASDRG